MIQEKKYQIEAVEALVKKTIKLLEAPEDRKKLVFKAPTGSGKTMMASKMLDDLTSQLAEEGKEVAVIWIAPNKLHQQSYMSMKNFFSETHVLTPVMYDELDHSVDGYIKSGEVFFVNWESINKDRNVLVRDTENSSSIYDIVQRTKEDHHLPLIVVVDEEHMFGSRNAKQSEKVLKNLNPKVEIRISATPLPSSLSSADDIYNVPREEVIKEEMIKDGITINANVKEGDEMVGENAYLLDLALAKRKELKEAYEKEGVRINPLLLIQLPNDNSETLNEGERAIVDMVKNRLETEYDITTDNAKLAIWLSTEKKNLGGLERNYNLTDVLLFKQAIALGWDCPRAAVLLIFRDIKSTEFGTQTVGRIMRMPEQHYYTDGILNHGWVYTNLSRDRIEIVADDMSYITKALLSYRREHLNNVALTSTYSQYLSADRNRLGPDFYPLLVETFNNAWFKQPIQLSFFDSDPFDDDDNEDKAGSDNGGFMIDVDKNRKQAERIDSICFDKHTIKVNILRDVEITGEMGTTMVDENKRISFTRNQYELSLALDKFYKDLLAGYEKGAVKVLHGNMDELMGEYLGIFETDVPSIILYNRNKGKFAAIINRAVAKYTKIISERKKKRKERSFKQYTWNVPEIREYNETTYSENDARKNHAMLPYMQFNDDSFQERDFEAFLEEYADCIDWWYKNGDEGRQHYAIPYTKKTGEKSLFYVDYVIRMKNGQIFLFDTKGVGSDENGQEKHNAIIDYMASEENKDKHLKGGIIIHQQSDDNWYYSSLPIENTTDLTGWDAFFPDKYK